MKEIIIFALSIAVIMSWAMIMESAARINVLEQELDMHTSLFHAPYDLEYRVRKIEFNQ
jgi:hypothetical protein